VKGCGIFIVAGGIMLVALGIALSSGPAGAEGGGVIGGWLLLVALLVLVVGFVLIAKSLIAKSAGMPPTGSADAPPVTGDEQDERQTS
jgi:hypothetical protein